MSLKWLDSFFDCDSSSVGGGGSAESFGDSVLSENPVVSEEGAEGADDGPPPTKRQPLERSVSAGSAGAANPLPQRAPWSDDPKFTPRDEEREWAAVSPAEMLEIESDLRGLNVADAAAVMAAASPDARRAPSARGGSMCGGTVSAGGEGRGSRASRLMTDDEREGALLPALEAELAAIPKAEKAAYLEAQRKCPDQVNDERKKAFIWREDFDPKLAAKRLIRHWQHKLELFGPTKCFLPMTLSGAMSGDMVALSDGFISLLPARDAYGRVIVCCETNRLDLTKYSRESMMRAFWYLFHVATQDPADRRCGYVALFFCDLTWEKFDPTTYRRCVAIPIRHMTARARSIHLCNTNRFYHLFAPFVKAIFEERGRKRLRVHSGSKDDVLRSLACYGLGAECLPRMVVGGALDANPVRWLSERMLEEASGGWMAVDLPVAGVEWPVAGGWDRDGPDSTVTQMSGHVNEAIESTAFSAPNASYSGPSVGGVQPDEVRGMLAVEKAQSSQRRRDKFADAEVVFKDDTKELTPLAVKSTSQAKLGVDSPQRARDPTFQDMAGCDAPPISAMTANPPSKQMARSCGDPRMDRAVQAKLKNPEMSSFDALLAGGFDYHTARGRKGMTDSHIKDNENVSLFQRKNQLCKILRELRTAGPGKVCANDSLPAIPVLPVSNPGKGKESKGPGDPRMARAVKAKSQNPSMSLLDALIYGGFTDYAATRPKGWTDKQIKDSQSVSLFQRKNQLSRRLRQLRKSGDPRMSRAVAVKRENPQMSSVKALLSGGFRFPELGRPGLCDAQILEHMRGVSLFSLKNELEKRLKELELHAEPLQVDKTEQKSVPDEAIHPRKATRPKCQQGQELCGHAKEQPAPLLSCEMSTVKDKRTATKSSMKKSDSFEKIINELPGLERLDSFEKNCPGLAKLDSFEKSATSCSGLPTSMLVGTNNNGGLHNDTERDKLMIGSWLWQAKEDAAAHIWC